jgi:hypothetical protein
MTSMRRIRLACAALVLAAVSATPARAAFIATSQPTASYVASTRLFSFSDPDNAVVSSLSNGFTITSLNPLVALTTPTTWSSWGAPPFTETATPRVLWTDAFTSLTLTSSTPVFTFGFEAQPNSDTFVSMTATYFNNNTQVGQITQSVNGNAGARLFGGTSDTPFNRVVVSSTVDFAIAQIRASPSVVPEPTSLVQLASASLLGVAAWWIRRVKRHPRPVFGERHQTPRSL